MEVFSIELFGRIEDPSPGHYTQTGTVVVVDGQELVRLPSGNVFVRHDPDRWSPTLAEAKRSAADRLAALARAIEAKAAAFRSEAELEEATS